MLYSRIPNTNLEVSRLGFGCWSLAGKGWSGTNPQQTVKTLELSFEAGINLFDTAPVYGFGRSEEVLGEVLSSVRGKVIFATKCGLSWDKFGKVIHDLSRDAILSELEKSLKRLKTDYLDILQVHWPDPQISLEETFRCLRELKESGVVRSVGICNYPLQMISEARKYCEIISLQDKYNFIERSAEKSLLSYCQKEKLAFFAYSPLAQGLLGGLYHSESVLPKNDIRRMNPLFNNQNNFENVLKQVAGMKKYPAAKALSFLFNDDRVTSVLVGMTKEHHLRQNIKTLNESSVRGRDE
jgi:aryl-alcohol dehydrogenase-like predicted oxidoreductase